VAGRKLQIIIENDKIILVFIFLLFARHGSFRGDIYLLFIIFPYRSGSHPELKTLN